VIRLNDEKLSREKLSAFGFQLFSFLTTQTGQHPTNWWAW